MSMKNLINALKPMEALKKRSARHVGPLLCVQLVIKTLIMTLKSIGKH